MDKNFTLYKSDNEKQISWAFQRASRQVDLDVMLRAVPHEYKYLLYIGLPMNADDEAKNQYKSISDEIEEGFMFSTLKEYSPVGDDLATARHLFKIPDLG